MCRFRLLPSIEQVPVLAEHCRHARFVWNLAVEQQQHWQPGRQAPRCNEQCAQLTAVTARGDLGISRSVNREPQPCSPAA
ncbi:MAG TPA: helix-turn-helix domain-containing protein [Mycobacterium sp.]|uniref:helix-turn-helix domain-containing protein n=1 Tax=Mycobacterium sp. TaxID=1785 RepID=UPI002F41153C